MAHYNSSAYPSHAIVVVVPCIRRVAYPAQPMMMMMIMTLYSLLYIHMPLNGMAQLKFQELRKFLGYFTDNVSMSMTTKRRDAGKREIKFCILHFCSSVLLYAYRQLRGFYGLSSTKSQR